MKRFLAIVLLIVLVFYHIYPQAISFFGFSFLFTSGALGLGLYVYNGRPYTEIVSIIGAYLVFCFFYLITYYVTYRSDPYFISNTKSQVAWLFSAYLICYLFFQIHPRGQLSELLMYLVGAIVLQGIFAIAMYQSPEVSRFFTSLQMVDEIAQEKRAMTGDSRLLGYGTAFFGAGIIYGMGLILTIYILIRKKMNLPALIVVSTVYAFLFFVGLLSARTTMVGFATSIVLLALSFFFNSSPIKGQYVRFISIFALLGSVGYTLCYIYFPHFSDWAFEVFINYSNSGEIRTASSDSLENMARFPQDIKTMLFGRGGMQFWGSDVGLSRLAFYVGYPGTIAYFFFPFALTWMCMTKDKVANIMLLLLTPYAVALNIKGLADVNSFIYIFVFYFLHYKYYVFTPHLYRLGKINSSYKLRTTV